MASLLYFLYTLFKASTHSVVLVPDIAMGHCYLCSIIIISQVCLYLVSLHVYFLAVYIVF